MVGGIQTLIMNKETTFTSTKPCNMLYYNILIIIYIIYLSKLYLLLYIYLIKSNLTGEPMIRLPNIFNG